MPTLNIWCKDPNGAPVAGARVAIITKNASILPATRYTEGDGGCNLYWKGPAFSPPLEVDVLVDADGFKPFCTGVGALMFGQDDINFQVMLQPSFKQPLEVLAQIRGAMWTARLSLPYGPRPGQDDNCICGDYFECFTAEDQDRILANYGPRSARAYNTMPMGPMVDAGYHDQLPAVDWRGNPDPYLDAAAKAERAGVRINHFLRPDRGCAGLEWTVDDLNRELGPIFRSAKAQSIMRIVTLGWEPGPKYFYDNAWWVEMLAWQAETFPNALRLLHMVGDCDAPVGAADNGKPFGQMWGNVAPYIHGWLVQNNGYALSGQPLATPDFEHEFLMQFDQTNPKSLVRRFRDGFDGWPTFSAWGDSPILVYAGEFAAYNDYWNNAPESESVRLGAMALAVGAAGYFDGGHA